MCVCVCTRVYMGVPVGGGSRGGSDICIFFFLNFVVILVHRQGNVGVTFVACQGFAVKFQICPRYLASVVVHPLLLPWPYMQGPA